MTALNFVASPEIRTGPFHVFMGEIFLFMALPGSGGVSRGSGFFMELLIMIRLR